jgi:NH3-dependent NAD+ synthetase
MNFLPHTTDADFVHIVDRQLECVLLSARNVGNAEERCRKAADALNANSEALMLLGVDDRQEAARKIARAAVKEI